MHRVRLRDNGDRVAASSRGLRVGSGFVLTVRASTKQRSIESTRRRRDFNPPDVGARSSGGFERSTARPDVRVVKNKLPRTLAYVTRRAGNGIASISPDATNHKTNALFSLRFGARSLGDLHTRTPRRSGAGGSRSPRPPLRRATLCIYAYILPRACLAWAPTTFEQEVVRKRARPTREKSLPPP